MKNFGITKNGQESHLIEITNGSDIKLVVSDYGATIVSIFVKDKTDREKDVVLGYDSVSDYEDQRSYFGATIGRNANRIAHAACELDGAHYDLEKNDNGNNLHNGKNGFHCAVWEVKEITSDKVIFAYTSKDMEQDLPGNMQATVTYKVTKENEICIDYGAVSDKTTVANFTNHAYFNLNGHESGSIENHRLTLYADAYTPVVDAKSIPTGEIAPVFNTPMDFTKEKCVGQEIEADFTQLKYAGGYDHNFVLAKEHGTMKKAAKVIGDISGITMELFTDCPGIQFYTGNFVKRQEGKEKVFYDFRHGLCLEPQYYPNAINDKHFLSPVLEANEQYTSHIKLLFHSK